jgi:hypothetical protein
MGALLTWLAIWFVGSLILGVAFGRFIKDTQR